MENKYLKLLVNLLFILSTPFVTTLLCVNHEVYYVKYIIGCSFFCGLLVSKVFFSKYLYKNINYKYLIVSIFLGLYTIKLVSNYSNTGIYFLSGLIKRFLAINIGFNNVLILASILALPSVVCIIYMLLKMISPFIAEEYSKLTKAEKRFVLITTFLGVLATIFIYSSTSAFYSPQIGNHFVRYDVLYTSDSGAITMQNSFLNTGSEENDIRQPMFAIFAMPFAVFASLLSEFIFFLPEIYIFNVVQIFLLSISFVMIAKMLNIKEKTEVLFLMLSVSTFSFLIFSFMIEQYVTAFFYVALTLYLNYLRQDKTNYAYIGAVSTLLISGILFPLIGNLRKIKDYVFSALKCLGMFICCGIISSQILEFVTCMSQIDILLRFGGGSLSFYNKLLQFFNFVASIFIAPISTTEFIKGKHLYHMANVSSLSILGIIILCLCFISFVINRKNRMAVISMLWVVFSFIILCLVGWGTSENGLILYSLYFSWGYIALIYLLIDTVIKNDKCKLIIILILCFIMLYFNIGELIQIIKFGMKYYPIG